MNIKDMPLMWYLNYLAKIPEVSRENLLFPRRRQIALTKVVDFGAKLGSAQKGMRSE